MDICLEIGWVVEDFFIHIRITVIMRNVFIRAKFASVCCETGQPIKKGQIVLFDRANQVVYGKNSPTYKGELLYQKNNNR